MIRLFAASALVATLIIAGPAASGPLEDAKTAFDAGDYPRALSLWRSQAQIGNPQAQNDVGLMYLAGQGGAENDAEAVRWFRIAALKGLADAQFNLAECYATGHGVPKDPASASEWYAKAANQGQAGAQYEMGVLLRTGTDLQSVLSEAAEWFKKAADQGHVAAQIDLAVMFAEGQGVPRDNIEALKWLDIVARRLPETDTARRDAVNRTRAALAAKMTAEQIAYAESFADTWEPTRP